MLQSKESPWNRSVWNRLLVKKPKRSNSSIETSWLKRDEKWKKWQNKSHQGTLGRIRAKTNDAMRESKFDKMLRFIRKQRFQNSSDGILQGKDPWSVHASKKETSWTRSGLNNEADHQWHCCMRFFNVGTTSTQHCASRFEDLEHHGAWRLIQNNWFWFFKKTCHQKLIWTDQKYFTWDSNYHGSWSFSQEKLWLKGNNYGI